MANKKAYFQGGGGVNEPTPGKKKYKSDPAIVVQPRFKEPFYRNYDLYKVPGMEEVGPGVGWHDMQQYDSVQEFLEARRKRLKPRYVADDSWQLDSGERTKTKPKMAMRMAIFDKMIKQADGECQDSDIEYTDSRDAYICGKCFHMSENCGGPRPSAKELHSGKNHNKLRIDWRDGSNRDNRLSDPNYIKWKENLDKQDGDNNDGGNYDYGDGAYTQMSDGKKMKTITDGKHTSPGAFFADAQYMMPPKEHGQSIYNWKNSPYQGTPGKKKKDSNDIDFPLDDQIKADPIVPEAGEYQVRNQMGDLYELPDGGSDLDPQQNNISLTTPQISGEHSYLPSPDFQGRSDDALNFGRDYDDEQEPGGLSDEDLDKLKNKYLTPKETSLFGLPDGISPPEDLDPEATVSDENPDYGTTNSGNTLYEGM